MNARFFLLILLVNIRISSMEHCRKEKIVVVVDNDAQDAYGRTSLMRATRRGSVTKIEPLLTGGANVNLQDKNGRTALILTLATPLEGTIRYVVAELLACKDIDLLIEDNQGLNALAMVKKQEQKWIYSRYIYREIGRMLLTHLRLYSPHGRVAKSGLQEKLPLDVLKYIATYIDYKSAGNKFKR